jgi:hypothetical protein
VSRPWIAFITFVVGALLVLIVDAGIARIIGVPLLFVGLVLGVASIVTPEFLAGDRGAEPAPAANGEGGSGGSGGEAAGGS